MPLPGGQLRQRAGRRSSEPGSTGSRDRVRECLGSPGGERGGMKLGMSGKWGTNMEKHVYVWEVGMNMGERCRESGKGRSVLREALTRYPAPLSRETRFLSSWT